MQKLHDPSTLPVGGATPQRKESKSLDLKGNNGYIHLFKHFPILPILLSTHFLNMLVIYSGCFSATSLVSCLKKQKEKKHLEELLDCFRILRPACLSHPSSKEMICTWAIYKCCKLWSRVQSHMCAFAFTRKTS